ncbi:MAG: tRNA (adenosine(37)-N6)-dimethylallyltransferase MiaA [Anaerolineales bacterium]
MSPKKPLAVIVGPTAVGKTKVSVQLARLLDGEIVSADSRLVYRGMDIGTAKPTATERRLVLHHLVDVVPPTETYGLARYQRHANKTIDEIHERGNLPFLVGGTGQFVTGVLEGWRPPPRPDDQSLRRELEAFADEHGHEALHARLARVDPVRAESIDARNVRRVVRALEIYQVTGKPPSDLRVKQPTSFDVFQIGLSRPRGELYQRIDERIDRMLAAGWLDEVRGLLADGVPLSAPSMSAIGYRQLARHLRGECTLAEAKSEIARLSRQFVRRQANWFKSDDPDIHWFPMDVGGIDRIEAALREWLEGVGRA